MDDARSNSSSGNLEGTGFRLLSARPLADGRATSSIRSEPAEGAAKSTVELLDVSACLFQHLDQDELDAFALSYRREVNTDWLVKVAALAASEVVSASAAVTINDLAGHYPNEGWLQLTGLASYLGVPLCDSEGAVIGVAAMFGSASRRFDENDEWWLNKAAKSVSDALVETLKAKQVARVLPSQPTTATPQEPREEEPVDPRPLVLVIDDDELVNSMICEVLTDEGFRIEAALDGFEGVKKFQPKKHDLVITDLVMPGMNGWEVAAALRKRKPGLPIVLITGQGSGSWNAPFLREQGIAAVLHKPFDFGLLCTVLKNLTAHAERLAAHHPAVLLPPKLSRVVW
jgi:CheY-like chemotaxis protein